MNLFELTENYVKFFTEFESADEVTEEMQEMADNLNVEIEEKCDNYAKMIRNLEADAEAYKNQEKIFTDKRRSAEKKATDMKKFIEYSMQQTKQQRVKTNLFTLNIQKNTPSLEITSEDHIDDSYYRVERILNKRELLNDIKEGLIVDGVEIKQTESLRIR